MILLLILFLFPGNLRYVYMFILVSNPFVLVLQLCAIVYFWLYFWLSDVHKRQLCWLVCHALHRVYYRVFICSVGCSSNFCFLPPIWCPQLIHPFLFLVSFKDPGPHGNGRYSQRMLPEVEIKNFRKGAQVYYPKIGCLQEILYFK